MRASLCLFAFVAVSVPSCTAGDATLAPAVTPAVVAAPLPSPPNKIVAFQKEASVLKQAWSDDFLSQAEYALELAKLKVKYGIGAQP